jgi:hypothetical protein
VSGKGSNLGLCGKTFPLLDLPKKGGILKRALITISYKKWKCWHEN